MQTGITTNGQSRLVLWWPPILLNMPPPRQTSAGTSHQRTAGRDGVGPGARRGIPDIPRGSTADDCSAAVRSATNSTAMPEMVIASHESGVFARRIGVETSAQKLRSEGGKVAAAFPKRGNRVQVRVESRFSSLSVYSREIAAGFVGQRNGDQVRLESQSRSMSVYSRNLATSRSRPRHEAVPVRWQERRRQPRFGSMCIYTRHWRLREVGYGRAAGFATSEPEPKSEPNRDSAPCAVYSRDLATSPNRKRSADRSDLVLVGLPQYGHCTRPTK